MPKGFSSVILAAGEGTRMKSSTPKVLHTLGGKAMLAHVLDTVLGLKLDKNALVLGHGSDIIKDYLGTRAAYRDFKLVLQPQRLGSGHAVKQAAKVFSSYRGNVLVLCADVPLIKSATLKELMDIHKKQRNAVTVLTTIVPDPTGYGRIIRNGNGEMTKIVEEKDALAWERRIREINSGIYCFNAQKLFRILQRLKPNNQKKEYYLTDAVELFGRQKARIGTMLCGDYREVSGINNRRQLAEANCQLNQEILTALMMSGVTILDPATVWIEPTVTIGRDTTIYPGTMIQGQTRIGEGCQIGPNTLIKEAIIANGVEIRASFIYEAEIGARAKIGPFAHVRPKTLIGEEARIGNFVEVKKSRIGRGSKVSHLTYIGDTTMGAGINIGAGVITCNYDGANKFETLIEDNVFVGSNVNLVAPLKIGTGAIIGAGSTITEDVPPNSLALARARQVNKENWALQKKKK